MHTTEVVTSQTGLPRVAHPILFADHDWQFGTLMRAAFASRGRRAEWTDRITEALRLLARHEFDPVIIDLRLCDGSGLDLLEEAIDAGLLSPYGTVMLASHDFNESSGAIRPAVLLTPPTALLNLEGFLQRMLTVAVEPRAQMEPRGMSIQLVRYVTGSSGWHPDDGDMGALSDVRFSLCELSHDG